MNSYFLLTKRVVRSMAPALMMTYLILRCLYCRMTSSNISGLISMNIFKALYTMPCMVLKDVKGK